MKKKILIGFLLLALQVFLVGGATSAYFTAEAAPKGREFDTGTVEIAVRHQPAGASRSTVDFEQSGSEKALWKIENTGKEDVRLRIKVIKTLSPDPCSAANIPAAQSFELKGAEPAIVPESDVELEVSEGWDLDVYDGYYYYNSTVPNGASVEFELTLNVMGGWSGDCRLEIVAQALQASNTSEDTWEKYIN